MPGGTASGLIQHCVQAGIAKTLRKSHTDNLRLLGLPKLICIALLLSIAVATHYSVKNAYGETPGSVAASLNAYNEVSLYWTAPAIDTQITDYEVWYKAGSVNYVLLANTGNQTIYNHKDLIPEKTYFYEVYAITKEKGKVLVGQTSIATARTSCTPDESWCFRLVSAAVSKSISYVRGELTINAQVLQGGSSEDGAVFIVFYMTDPDGNQSVLDTKKIFTARGENKDVAFSYIPEKNGDYHVNLELISPTGYSFDKRSVDFHVSEDISYYQSGGWREPMIYAIFAGVGIVVYIVAVKRFRKKSEE